MLARSMPIVYCRNICSGNGDRCCRWSTELQEQPATIRSDAVACQVCLAQAGGAWQELDLAVQLVSLHELDPNLYSLAASGFVMSRTTIEALTQRILDVMVSTVPKLKRTREHRRQFMLANTLKHLTAESWVLDGLERKTREDTKDFSHATVAMRGKLPYTAIGLVMDYLCGVLMPLYSHLCALKTNTYHTLERPIFWYPKHDFEYSSIHNPGTLQTLVTVYSHVLDHYHKPKLARIKSTLVKHYAFVTNHAMSGRVNQCASLLILLDRMLRHEVVIFDQPPFIRTFCAAEV